MSKLLAFALFVAACSSPDELYDPTGSWSMTARWGDGDCMITGTSAQPVVVARIGADLVATTTEPAETTTGTVAFDAISATLNVTITDPDVLDDGRTIGRTTLTAVADETMAITGTGQAGLVGAVNCAQVFTLTGVLNP